MKFLLDTHLLLWWLNNDPCLSPTARAAIADPDHTLFVSAMSHWEIALKASLGKLIIPENFFAALAEEAFEDLPFTKAHAQRLMTLPWHHRDPFDRALLAQAQAEGLTLLTHDRTLTPYGPFVQPV